MQKSYLVVLLVIISLVSFVQAQCTQPVARNCNGECSHLQSYPTYEKESCITACVAENQQEWSDYYACQDSQPEPEPIPVVYDDEEEEDPCEDIECDDYCSGTNYYYDGTCDYGECEYRTEKNSEDCGYEDLCANLKCEDRCEGTTLYYGGYCSEGACNFGVEENSYDCGYEEDVIDEKIYDLSDEKLREMLVLYSQYTYYALIEEDEKAARLYFTRLNQLFKEAADEAGLDSSQYDVFELLEPLKENQQSMSDKEKEDRLAAAQLAYEDVIIDDIVSVTNGITKEDKQRIEDKKEEVKAQYGRVLLFDPDNVKANKALGDIYLKEGKQDDAEVFLKRALKNADKEEYSKIKSKIRQKAIDNLKIKKVPEEKGLFLALKKSAEQANEKIQANINRKEEEINNWYNSFKISKSMKDIWEDANEIIFSASEKKAKEAAEE